MPRSTLSIPGKAYAIIESSQFQLYLAEYERDDSSLGNESEFVGMTGNEEVEFEEVMEQESQFDPKFQFRQVRPGTPRESSGPMHIPVNYDECGNRSANRSPACRKRTFHILAYFFV